MDLFKYDKVYLLLLLYYAIEAWQNLVKVVSKLRHKGFISLPDLLRLLYTLA